MNLRNKHTSKLTNKCCELEWEPGVPATMALAIRSENKQNDRLPDGGALQLISDWWLGCALPWLWLRRGWWWWWRVKWESGPMERRPKGLASFDPTVALLFDRSGLDKKDDDAEWGSDGSWGAGSVFKRKLAGRRRGWPEFVVLLEPLVLTFTVLDKAVDRPTCSLASGLEPVSGAWVAPLDTVSGETGDGSVRESAPNVIHIELKSKGKTCTDWVHGSEGKDEKRERFASFYLEPVTMKTRDIRKIHGELVSKIWLVRDTESNNQVLHAGKDSAYDAWFTSVILLSQPNQWGTRQRDRGLSFEIKSRSSAVARFFSTPN